MNAHLIAVIDRAKPAHHETAEGRNSVGDAESEMQTATDTPGDRWEKDKGDDEWDENEWEEHGEGQEGQQWETEEAIENEMKWGDGNVEDTEETTRQHDAQGDGCDVDAETSAKNDEGGTPTCEACERQVGDDDSREQGDSDSDTSEDEVHKTQRDENDSSGKTVPKWGVKRLKEDRKGRLRRKAAKWAELMRRAQRYPGGHWTRGKCPHQRLSRQPAILTIMETRSMGREQRKAMMAALCKKKASKYEARLQRLESETTKAEELIADMEKVIARATMGSVIHGIFEVLARAMGKTGAGGAGKLVEINGITKQFEGKTVRGASLH